MNWVPAECSRSCDWRWMFDWIVAMTVRFWFTASRTFTWWRIRPTPVNWQVSRWTGISSATPSIRSPTASFATKTSTSPASKFRNWTTFRNRELIHSFRIQSDDLLTESNWPFRARLANTFKLCPSSGSYASVSSGTSYTFSKACWPRNEWIAVIWLAKNK